MRSESFNNLVNDDKNFEHCLDDVKVSDIRLSVAERYEK